MLKQIIPLKKVIYNELVDLKLEKLWLTDDEFKAVETLVEALEIVEVGSRKLCSRKVTLGKADEIFEKMLVKLYKLKSDIGRKLYNSVEYRVNERRNKVLATLQAFLEDHEFFEHIEQGEDMKMLEYADRTEMKRLAKELYTRLFLNSRHDAVEIIQLDTNTPGKECDCSVCN